MNIGIVSRLQCDVGVSCIQHAFSGVMAQCYVYQNPSLFPILFLQSLYVPFNYWYVASPVCIYLQHSRTDFNQCAYIIHACGMCYTL